MVLRKIHSVWCLSLHLTYFRHASKSQLDTVITMWLFMKHFKGVENEGIRCRLMTLISASHSICECKTEMMISYKG